MPYKDPDYMKKWWKAHPDYAKEWTHTHPISVATSGKKYALRLRSAVLELLGNKCVKCGFSDPRALQIDHVNGGGMQERRDLKHKGSGKKYHNVVIKSVLNKEGRYQLLCANCNWIKKVENKELYKKQ